MNREDITRMAREADINVDGDAQGCLLRFICVENDLERFFQAAYALGAAAEREACAKAAEAWPFNTPEQIAAAIRERGNT